MNHFSRVPGDGCHYLNQMLPFNLEIGLILEDAGLALRWCDERDTLTNSADYWQRSGNSLILAWKSRRMLGGLNGNATTKLLDSPNAKPIGFKLGLSCGDGAGQTLAMGYNNLYAVMVARFGLPQDRIDYSDSPEAMWKLDGIAIRHQYWDGFGGDLFVLIYPESKITNNKPLDTKPSISRFGLR